MLREFGTLLKTCGFDADDRFECIFRSHGMGKWCMLRRNHHFLKQVLGGTKVGVKLNQI